MTYGYGYNNNGFKKRGYYSRRYKNRLSKLQINRKMDFNTGLSDQNYVKLSYSTNGNTLPGATDYGNQAFIKLNSLFKVENNSDNTSVIGTSELGNLYNRYLVVGCKLELHGQADINSVGMMTMFAYPRNGISVSDYTQTSGPGTLTAWAHNLAVSGSKIATCGTSSGSPAIINYYVTPFKVLGQKNQGIESGQAGDLKTLGDPNDICYFVWGTANTNAATTEKLHVSIKVTYYVLLGGKQKFGPNS
jgi:hypothetical protein